MDPTLLKAVYKVVLAGAAGYRKEAMVDRPERARAHDSKRRAEARKEGKRKLTPLERCEKKIRAAKRATRSELSVTGGEWQKHGYAYDAKVLSPDGIGDDIERISAKEVSVEEFIERFGRPCRPCPWGRAKCRRRWRELKKNEF